jgi:putative flippase GtrA
MPPRAGSPVVASRAPRHGLVPKLLRYFTGSVVATVCSEVVFVLLYGVVGMGTTWSSVLSWVAGAVPNFWLNRNWAWQRTGRPSLRHEVVPYVVIIGITLALATVTTSLVDHWLHDRGTSASLRVFLVAAVFLGVYVVVFAARFFLLERLFARLPHHSETVGRDEHAAPTEEAR